jgi:hypothetical protein
VICASFDFLEHSPIGGQTQPRPGPEGQGPECVLQLFELWFQLADY